MHHIRRSKREILSLQIRFQLFVLAHFEAFLLTDCLLLKLKAFHGLKEYCLQFLADKTHLQDQDCSAKVDRLI